MFRILNKYWTVDNDIHSLKYLEGVLTSANYFEMHFKMCWTDEQVEKDEYKDGDVKK